MVLLDDVVEVNYLVTGFGYPYWHGRFVGPSPKGEPRQTPVSARTPFPTKREGGPAVMRTMVSGVEGADNHKDDGIQEETDGDVNHITSLL